MQITICRIALAVLALGIAFSAVDCVRQHERNEIKDSSGSVAATATVEGEDSSTCALKSDTILIDNAVGPSWVGWDSPCLPNADLVYVDLDTWDIWIMDEWAGNQRCLTCYNDNILGVNFPLDDDGRAPAVHWKGDPEAHPTEPIIFFKAENENSAHRKLRNSPSIGWDNDIWAVNVCTKRYTRLTNIAAGDGIQHSAISDDGQWYVYPYRYDIGNPPKDFGYASMIFCELFVDQYGNAHIANRFEDIPNGEMYYEPHDIRKNDSGSYTLLYTAGSGNKLDPYRYEWRCAEKDCSVTNKQFLNTPFRHEEFSMFSPSGQKIVWMKGPLIGLGYHADLYVSTP